MRTAITYLLHFDRRISPSHTTQHYLGSADDLDARIWKHRHHPDARLLQVAKERGIHFTVARTWTGGRELERKLKNQKNAPKLCPICAAQRRQHAQLERFRLEELSELSF